MVSGHCMQATVHWNIIGFLPQQPHTVLLTGAIFDRIYSTGALMPLVYLQIFSVKISPLCMSEVVVGEQVT